MSISAGGVTGFSSSSQWPSLATTPKSTASASADASFVDGIQVNLPNGLSVGVFRISGDAGGTQSGSSASASSAQMLQMVEQLVADFANGTGATSNGTAAANPTGSPLVGTLAPGQSMDGIDVSLPNGYSADIYHVDQAGGSSQSSDNEMLDMMQQLVANLQTYSGTSTSAYAKTAADASPTTTNVNSVA
jgi:hypothetical protein